MNQWIQQPWNYNSEVAEINSLLTNTWARWRFRNAKWFCKLCVCVCAHGDRRAHIALINNTPLFPTLLIICQPVQVSMSQSFKKGINLLLHSRHTARHSNLLSPHRDPTLQAGLNQCFLSLFDLHPVIKCGAQKKKKKGGSGEKWLTSATEERRENLNAEQLFHTTD